MISNALRAKTDVEVVWTEVRSQVEATCSAEEMQLIKNAIKVCVFKPRPFYYAWAVVVLMLR